jgi:signal peptidase I
VLCLVVLLAGATMGVRPLVFRSGSMAPAIDTGDLALSRTVPASDLHIGDIVSILDASGTRVTHRVVNIAAQGDARQLTLQGDANNKPDGEVYTVDEAQRVLFHVPRLGYVIGWLTGPIGIFLLGLYAALLLSVAFRRKGPGRDDPPAPTKKEPARRRAAQARRRRLPAALSLAVVSVGVLWPAPGWAAPWTNDVVISGTTVTAKIVPPPATFTCGGLGLLSVTFNWAAVSGVTNYTLHYGTAGVTTLNTTATTATITSALSGGTAWVVTNINYGSTTWSSVASTTRSYTVAVVSLCS